MTRDHDTFDFMDDNRRERGRFGDAPSHGDVALVLALHHETEQGHPSRGAVWVSTDGEETGAEWIPKALIKKYEHNRTTIKGHRKNGQAVELASVTLVMSESIAKEKGLV